RVRWDDAGRITSIFDETAASEMLKAGPIGALHIARGREDFKPEPMAAATVRSNNGPVFRTLELARPGSAMPLATVTLYAGARFADVRFDIDLNAIRST